MSTVFSHPVIPLAIGAGLSPAARPGLPGSPGSPGSRIISLRLIVLGCLFSLIPDLDVIGFELGVSYWSPYGHRGFTHSIAFAAACSFIAQYWSHYLQSSRAITFVYLWVRMASHGVLDAMTYGGLGVAFMWPFDNAREFFPWRPLPVSPIGIDRFFNSWGLYVMKTEIYLIWLPAAVVATLGAVIGWMYWKRR